MAEAAEPDSHRSVALSGTGASTALSEVTGEQLSTQVLVLTLFCCPSSISLHNLPLT